MDWKPSHWLGGLEIPLWWVICLQLHHCIVSVDVESRGMLMTQLLQSFELLSKLSLQSNIRPRNMWFPALLITFGIISGQALHIFL